jgi:hypothetical protein
MTRPPGKDMGALRVLVRTVLEVRLRFDTRGVTRVPVTYIHMQIQMYFHVDFFRVR